MGLRLSLLGDPVDYAYDALGRQVAVTDPLGHTITTTYDAEDHILAQRGAGNNNTDIMGTILFKPYQDLGEGLFFDN